MNLIPAELGFSHGLLRQSLFLASPELFNRFINLEKKVIENLLPFANLSNFTDHGVKHSKVVQKNLDQLVPQDLPEPLTPFEIFALLSATILHDVGMAVSKSQRETVRQIRIDHYNRSREFVCENHNELDLSSHESFIIGEVCRAHGMPDLQYLEGHPFSLSGHGNVRVALLSALIRLADALDLSPDRAPLVMSNNRVMSKESQGHWNLHQSISDVQIGTAPSWEIIISAIPKKRSIILDLYRLQGNIQKELDTIYPVLMGAGIFFKKVELHLNPLLISKPKKPLKNPFIRLAPFSHKTAFLFAGRSKETEQLIERIHNRNLVLVIGESGVGKTSIVEAGVIPNLKPYKIGIIRFSFQNDPVGNLITELFNFSKLKVKVNSIISHSDRPSKDLLQVIEKVLEKRKKTIRKLLIIGDHLEQMFTMNMGDEALSDFIFQFSRVLHKLNSDFVTFLFCIRQDYLPNLYDLSMHIPELYDRKNTFKLNRLSKENGLEVIRRASKSARVKLQDSLIERILDDLCQEGYGMIYPPYLQIVGYNLYVSLNKKFELENSQNITESLYEKLGGLENIINHYFDGLLDRFTQEDKVMVGQILHTMVTNYYTKKRVTKEYLQVTLPECHNLDELLKNLIQDRIIMRSLGEYELISDLLALRVIQLIQNNTFLSPPVRRALEYIERNFSTPNLNSRRVAEAAGVSQMHLAVLFRKQIHKTINHQINAIRIAKAKEVLAKNRDRITDVAKKAGFKSLSSFSRKFKKIDGSSPLVYRNILTMKWQDSNLLRGV